MLKLQLKSDDKIKAKLEDWEGTLHTNGIAYSNNIVGGTTEMCTKVLIDGDRFAFETLSGMYLSHRWVTKIGDVTVKKDSKVVGGKYILLSDYYLDIENMSFISTDDMMLCGCGKIATHKSHEGEKICPSCLVKKYYNVNGYSYKPEPTFFGDQIKADETTPTYYGLELEYGFNNLEAMALLMMNSKELYLKSDSSIRGGEHRTEVVTHPMSFGYIMNEAKWIDAVSTIGAEHNPTTNGCHIHISRTAFSDDKHYSLFYFMMHNMYDILQFVGGREFTDYCKPQSYGKVFTKTKGSKDNSSDSRSVMLNETNDYTVEARFFASTDNAQEIKMYVQLLESVIKYTKYKSNCTVTGWKKYVQKYSTKYNFLSAKLEHANEDWFNGSITYRAPRVINKSLDKIVASKLQCISKITLKSGTVLDNVIAVRFSNSGRKVSITYKNGNAGYDATLSEVDFCTLEE